MLLLQPENSSYFSVLLPCLNIIQARKLHPGMDFLEYLPTQLHRTPTILCMLPAWRQPPCSIMYLSVQGACTYQVIVTNLKAGAGI